MNQQAHVLPNYNYSREHVQVYMCVFGWMHLRALAFT